MANGKTKLELTWIGKENRPKLEAQKKIKALEKNRKTKRAEFYAEQDRIDTKRDDLIGDIEKQLNQQHSTAPLFTIRWTVV